MSCPPPPLLLILLVVISTITITLIAGKVVAKRMDADGSVRAWRVRAYSSHALKAYSVPEGEAHHAVSRDVQKENVRDSIG